MLGSKRGYNVGIALLIFAMLLGGALCAAVTGCTQTEQPEPASIRYSGSSIEIMYDSPTGASEFEIYRSASRLGEKTRLAATPKASYIDTSPSAGKYENHYTVVAKTSDGSVISSIRWNKIDNAASYEVFRRVPAGGEFVFVGSVSTNSFTESISGYELGKEEYRVDPLNSEGKIIKGNFDLDSGIEPPSGYPSHSIAASVTRNIVLHTVYPQLISFEREMFGENVFFYDARHDSIDDIESEINRIADAMRSHVNDVQMSDSRYAIYFKPGEYQFSRIDVGFYMTVAGLGLTPTQTRLGGTIYTPPALPYNNNNGLNGTHNFWRAIENFEIYRPSGAGAVTLGWSVSQAAPMRRISVASGVSTNYNMNSPSGWVSGGYTADVQFMGSVAGGGQQQWYTRNSHFGGGAMSGVGWNNFSIASTGTPFSGTGYMNGGSRTWIADGIKQMREKPFLYFDENEDEYKIFVPELRYDALGVSWTETDPGVGYSADIDSFYIAKSGDSAALINSKLKSGKHIFYTPGVYECETPIHIKNADTVVLGTGLPTLHPSQSNKEGAMLVADVSGVTVAGLFIDAHYSSKYLLRVGEVGSNADHSANPSFFSDIFLRIGGYKTTPVHTEIAVHINSNNVIGDHFWVWRADHGRQGSGTRHSWKWENWRAPFGVVVQGNDVTLHGLFVEHFQKYQTLWLGERGEVFFYQNETPYEVQNQEGYMSHGGTVNGWSSFKIANHVEDFHAIGLGMYGIYYNETNPKIILANAVEAPHKPGVRLEALYTNKLSSNKGDIANIINGVGGMPTNTTGVRIAVFENGIANRTASQTLPGAVQPPDEDFADLLKAAM